MTAGGTETPDDFSGLIFFPILEFRTFAQISQCLGILVPFLSSRTLDLHRDSEGRTGFELMTVELACREYELKPPVLTARPPLPQFTYLFTAPHAAVPNPACTNHRNNHLDL